MTLVRKEVRELFASRPMLFVALAAGPLVAHGFATALDAYSEASGVPGGAAALTQALSPLDGFVVPTLGAYSVIATLLFPFVAIRGVSSEKESGAHLLALQGPFRLSTIVAAKFVAALAAWIALWIPGLLALAFWRAMGGHLDAGETSWVLGGHLLRGALVVSLGVASAAVAESGASAAVIALAVTLGGWALDFAATVQGGTVAALAQFTPDSSLRTFEQGNVQLRVIAVTLVVIVAFLLVAGTWLDPARPQRRRLMWGGTTLVAAALLAALATTLRPSWDTSEDRRNSFSRADQRLLATIAAPIKVTAYLGPEDPRRSDLEQNLLRKLRRAAPDVEVQYAAQSRTGLFEGPGSHYGEVWYEVEGKRELNRSSVETIALETIYRLAGVAEPVREENGYPGYPLRKHAMPWHVLVLALGWPLLVLAGWLAYRRSGGA